MMGSFTLDLGGKEPRPRPTEVKDRRRRCFTVVCFFLRAAKKIEDTARKARVPAIAGRCWSIVMFNVIQAERLLLINLLLRFWCMRSSKNIWQVST